jgi:hypothetical protein
MVSVATLVHSNANSKITTSNRIMVLQMQRKPIRPFIAAMEQATSSIHLSYYIGTATHSGPPTCCFGQESVVRCGRTYPVRSCWQLFGLWLAISAQSTRRGIEIRPFSALWRVHNNNIPSQSPQDRSDGAVGFTEVLEHRTNTLIHHWFCAGATHTLADRQRCAVFAVRAGLIGPTQPTRSLIRFRFAVTQKTTLRPILRPDLPVR